VAKIVLSQFVSDKQ
jgi:phenylalanyl-tRNA synthetase beta subunit